MVKKQSTTLTKTDLNNLRTVVREEVSEEIKYQLNEQLEDKLSFLPTKNEFFSKMDEVLGEVQGMREEFNMHQYRHEQINDDIKDLKHKTNHLYKIFQVDPPANLAY